MVCHFVKSLLITRLAGSDRESSGSVVGGEEGSQQLDDTGSVLRWLLRDEDEDPSSRRATVMTARLDSTAAREQGHSDQDGDDAGGDGIGVVANWLASLDLG